MKCAFFLQSFWTEILPAVSNPLRCPLTRSRMAFRASIAVVLIAILYRCWLVAPVLHYLAIRHWRFLALVVAAATGSILSLLRLPLLILACAAAAGLLSGGTWAACQAPSDVPISLIGAFGAHLEAFWREAIMLTVIISVSGFFCGRFVGHRSPSPD